MAQQRRAAKSEIRRLADLVQEAVDDGATTAEEIHKRIAALPLDALEQIDALQNAVSDVRRIQDRSIGAVYELIRTINHEVTELAAELLAGPKRRRPARKSSGTRKATRKTATA